MAKGGSGTTGGDRRRNARRGRLWAVLPRGGAVIDRDVRVLARKTVRVKAFGLGPALGWAVALALVKGFRGGDGGVRAGRAAVAAGAAVVRRAGPAAGVHPAAGLPYRR